MAKGLDEGAALREQGRVNRRRDLAEQRETCGEIGADPAAVRGVFGVPSLFVGDGRVFGKKRLGQAEEKLLVR